jgi:UDP-N-acetylmuramoyl-L-alanyl-D-glutamate--2,6-diaminopimelate ligase
VSGLDRIVDALRTAGNLVAAPDTLPEIGGVSADSRSVAEGDLFCAVRGTAADGHRFVADAARRGAAAICVEHPVAVGVPEIVVRDSRAAATTAAVEWFEHPSRGMRVVAVTGTNGKTTSVALIRHLLNADGTVGAIGTLGATDGRGRDVPGYSQLTTPGPLELQALLAGLREGGATGVVMEASSHALDQGRLGGVEVAAALFTNLTHEHLDYHADARAYRAAKLRLLDHVADGGVVAVNADDPAWAEMPVPAGRRTVRFGAAGDVRLATRRADALGSDVTFTVDGATVEARIPLPGSFNVANAAGAVAVAWGLGMSVADAVERLADAPQVPGRMERLVDGEVTVLRDYAHTPDALERLLAALRPVTAGRLVVLFGAGGDRDRSKRPAMGAVAERLADLVVLTSDNPRTEDPDAIMRDVEGGMAEPPHRRIADRAAAIATALDELESGDCLVLAGKGHETYQILGEERVDFDERVLVTAHPRMAR